jgi:hypothetical protein
MSDGWGRVELGNLVREKSLGTASRSVDGTGDLTLLKMGSLQHGHIDNSQVEPVSSKEIPNLDRIRLRRGDLIFNTRNTRNTPDLVGKVGVWHSDDAGTVPDNNFLILRFGKWNVSEYICAQLTAGRPAKEIRSIAIGSTSVAAIYWRDLSRIKIPLPSLDEQRRIAEILDDLDERIQAAQRISSKSKELRSGLLRNVMREGLELVGSVEASKLSSVQGTDRGDWTAWILAACSKVSMLAIAPTWKIRRPDWVSGEYSKSVRLVGMASGHGRIKSFGTRLCITRVSACMSVISL